MAVTTRLPYKKQAINILNDFLYSEQQRHPSVETREIGIVKNQHPIILIIFSIKVEYCAIS